jgi:hypothetical protein
MNINTVRRCLQGRNRLSGIYLVAALSVANLPSREAQADLAEVGFSPAVEIVVNPDQHSSDVYENVVLSFQASGSDAIRNDAAGNELRFHGDVTHNGAEIYTAEENLTVFSGHVGGAGPYTGFGEVKMEGVFSPGNSPAIVNFGGNLSLGPSSTLIMEIGGTTPGTQHDQLNVSGTFTANGTLQIVLINGFVPSVGNTFDLFNAAHFAGNFTSIISPPEFAGFSFNNILTSGNLTVSAVPETSPLLTIGFVTFGLCIAKHIKRKLQGHTKCGRDLGYFGAIAKCLRTHRPWRVRSIGERGLFSIR